MNAFRYQAIESSGAPATGVIEAEDRKAALRLLGQRGLYPSNLEPCSANGNGAPAAITDQPARKASGFGNRIKRKQITAFTREMSALLGAAIPIPQALNGLGEEEEKEAHAAVLGHIAGDEL